MNNGLRVFLIASCVLLLGVTVGCGVNADSPASTRTPPPTVTPAPPPVAVIQFTATPIDLDGVQWMEGQALEYGLSLAPSGIYALSQDTAFLFGGLRVPAGTIRSFLLRSEDGGQQWQEVMEPERGSEVRFLALVEGGHGWALVQWTVEGAGPISMYGTTDGGRAWQKLSDVPLWQWYGYPVRMAFFDELHGQIDVIYDAGLPPTNRIAYLTTADGGVSWQETSSLPLGSPREDAYSTLVAPYFADSAAAARRESAAQDGSTWRLESSQTLPGSFVTRRLPAEGTSITHSIPVHFTYSGGIVSLPE
jgi:hypothetical protein